MSMNIDLDFERRKREYDYNKFCKDSCRQLLEEEMGEAIYTQEQAEIVYSDIDHSLVRFDLKGGETVYFKVFHSETEGRYKTVPVVLREQDHKFHEVASIKEAVIRRDV